MREVTACDQGHYGITQVTIKVNGTEYWVTEDVNREQQCLDYEDIMRLAKKAGFNDDFFGITVRYASGKMQSVPRGGLCLIEEDMSIDVGSTSAA